MERFTGGVKSRTGADIFNSRTLSVPRPGWLLSSRRRGRAKGEDEEDDEDGCTLCRNEWRRGERGSKREMKGRGEGEMNERERERGLISISGMHHTETGRTIHGVAAARRNKLRCRLLNDADAVSVRVETPRRLATDAPAYPYLTLRSGDFLLVHRVSRSLGLARGSCRRESAAIST